MHQLDRKIGQVATFEEIETLVDKFELVLNQHGVTIESGSDLEAACLSVLEVLVKRQELNLRNPHEDIRAILTEVLGIWTFLTKTVRLKDHPNFNQFVPHLKLLNKGTVVQNKRLRAPEEAANKIFELLFAMVLLDVGKDLVLDHPSLGKGDNPDILVTMDNQRWGFACKVVNGLSGKTFFDNLKKGVEQVERSVADIGCVVVNFRNLLDHEAAWPILNPIEYHNGADPVFGASPDHLIISNELCNQVTQKRNQVIIEIGEQNVTNIFLGKKCISGFLAFCQTCAGKATTSSPVPMSISTLVMANFGDIQNHRLVFDNINLALHERKK